MFNTITKKQFKELEEAPVYLTIDKYHRLLEEYTGITAMPYKIFSYYDCDGNYIGDSDNSSLYNLLKSAYIKVVDDEQVHRNGFKRY